MLMTEVYESRARNIVEKKNITDEENERDRIAKEKISRDVAQADELERIRKSSLRDKKVQNQDHLKWQIEEKERRKTQTLQEEMLEKRAAKLAEMQYLKKIEGEKKRGMELLDALRAQRPY